MSKFYAVAVGAVPGVYTSWADAEKQVKGFSGAKYKSFPTLQAAQGFISEALSAVQEAKSGSYYPPLACPPAGPPEFTLAARPAGALQSSAGIALRESTSSIGSQGAGKFQIWKGPGNGGKSVPYALKRTEPSSLGGNYYGVAVGRTPGVYRTWKAAKAQVKGYPKAVYKKFATEAEAQAYIAPPADTGVERKDRLVIYIDGSFRNGKAGAGVWFPEEKKGLSEEVPGKFGKPTNNSGEVYAAYLALSAVPDRKIPLLIHPDSMYVINSVTGKWGINENVELFGELLEELKGRDVVWDHVYGHTGIDGNEKADHYAGLVTQ